jgi:hypothetical protein
LIGRSRSCTVNHIGHGGRSFLEHWRVCGEQRDDDALSQLDLQQRKRCAAVRSRSNGKTGPEIGRLDRVWQEPHRRQIVED